MRKANPKKNAKGDPVYVGSTAHTVECNYENGHLGNRGEEYLCTCFTQEKMRESKTRKSTRSMFVPEGLRYELFAHLNPVPKSERKEREKELATFLKEAGFLVWQN